MKTAMTSALALILALGAAHAQQVGETEMKVALSQHDGSEVLATVGENKVTLGDVALTYSTLPAEMRGATDEQILEAITEQLISEYALSEEAVAAGLEDKREVQNRLAAARRATLAEAFITQELKNRVTDEALREGYDSMIAESPEQEEVKARHILVETEDEAKDIVKQLGDGADFAELAKEKSTGPSGASGGDLGYFVKEDMVGPFAEAAFALETDAVSEPVKTQFGWHVIKLEDRRMRKPPSFEDLEPQLRAQLTRATAQQIIAEVREKTEVEKVEETPPAFLIRRSEMYTD